VQCRVTLMLSSMSSIEHSSIKPSKIEQSRAGFVLAGGNSSRMGPGIDKVFIDFKGDTLLERALATMRRVCANVTIVGDPIKFTKDASVVKDVYPGCGPLAGIHAALVQSSAELNFILAVDMPFVSTELLEFIFATAERATSTVTVPRSVGKIQPLCAVYRRDFAVIAEQAMRAGKYKIGATFSGLSVREIEEEELRAAGFSERNFTNVNTPQERIAAERNSLA
jgi:molybdopterin-guanine dinucleotide biosynthesis protein A